MAGRKLSKREEKMAKDIEKVVKKGLRVDKVKKGRGLIEGVDSPYQWEPINSIGGFKDNS